MKRIGVGIIGTGWCGGIRAETVRGAPAREESARRGDPAGAAARDCREDRGDDRDGRLSRAAPDRRDRCDDDLGDARVDAFSDGARRARRREARAPREADRDRARRGRRADRAGAAEQGSSSPIGYSQRFNPKYAYVKQCVRDGTIGNAGERAREPAHHPRTGQEDHRPLEALAGGDGVDARPRLRAVVPGAGQAGARVLAAHLRGDAGGDRRAIFPIASGSR